MQALVGTKPPQLHIPTPVYLLKHTRPVTGVTKRAFAARHNQIGLGCRQACKAARGSRPRMPQEQPDDGVMPFDSEVRFGVDSFSLQPAKSAPWLHPSTVAGLYWDTLCVAAPARIA